MRPAPSRRGRRGGRHDLRPRIRGADSRRGSRAHPAVGKQAPRRSSSSSKGSEGGGKRQGRRQPMIRVARAHARRRRTGPHRPPSPGCRLMVGSRGPPRPVTGPWRSPRDRPTLRTALLQRLRSRSRAAPSGRGRSGVAPPPHRPPPGAPGCGSTGGARQASFAPGGRCCARA